LVKNQNETSVDCGGSCSTKCANGADCAIDADCQSQVCTNGKCAVPTCSDTKKNGNETGTDCGGADCSNCAAGQGCITADDCVSAVCTGNLCIAATCSDTVQNQTETDVDCGGSCAPGLRCANGKKCSVAADCISGICTSSTCQAPATTPLRVVHYSITGDGTVQIKIQYGLKNTSSSAVALAGYSVRYWFTQDVATPSTPAACWYSYFGCGSLTFGFVPVSPARTKANYYIETAFSASSGSIAANFTADIAANFGFNETGWPTLSLANDHSYDAALTTGAENPKMTIYYNGALVWGTEPL
jgi:hypothetical protein